MDDQRVGHDGQPFVPGCAIASSAVGLFALAFASATGASFTNSGRPTDSMGMSVLTGVGLLLCYAANPYVLRPPRQRAYLVTDQAVANTAAHYADRRPELDQTSRRAITTSAGGDADLVGDASLPSAGDPEPDPGEETATADEALWLMLCLAPEEGADIAELLRITGMSRPTLYRRLADHARAGRAIQVSRGRWRAQTAQEPPRD